MPRRGARTDSVMAAVELAAALRRDGASQRDIAARLGVSRPSVQYYLQVATQIGLLTEGRSPATPVPGWCSRKTTVHTDASGRVVQEWRRWEPDQHALAAALAALVEPLRGRGRVPKPPRRTADDLLLEIAVADLHLGARPAAGHAHANLEQAVALALDGMPRPGRIALVLLGDLLHADNRAAVTERGGHRLDTAEGYIPTIEAAARGVRRLIEHCAGVAQQVDAVVIPGNHDWHAAQWLGLALELLYERTPRVRIHRGAPRCYLQHGQVLLAYMHGDTMRHRAFAQVVAAEAAEAWGATVHRYGRTGHWHHRLVEEAPGVVVETMPSMAPPDDWAQAHGHLHRRALLATLFHARHGRVATREVSLAELDPASSRPR